MKNFNLCIFFLAVFVSCSPRPTNKEISTNYLIENGFIPDHTIDKKLNDVIKGINLLARNKLNKEFVLDQDYNPSDSNQILVVPFRRKMEIGTVSAFSSIKDRLVFISPLQIKKFVESNSLNDNADISGYLGIILLHELSHFSLRISGSYDETSGEPEEQESKIGGQNMGTEPILMTSKKRLELKVDSLAVELVKSGIKVTDGDCFHTCLNIELAINGAEFMLFGKRLIENFGTTTPKMIRDNSWTHPNLELRLAFMNFYLNPTLEKQRQIDDYLYEREVEPVHRQEINPLIFHGERKIN
jgi:hypothetical protein